MSISLVTSLPPPMTTVQHTFHLSQKLLYLLRKLFVFFLVFFLKHEDDDR